MEDSPLIQSSIPAIFQIYFDGGLIFFNELEWTAYKKGKSDQTALSVAIRQKETQEFRTVRTHLGFVVMSPVKKQAHLRVFKKVE